MCMFAWVGVKSKRAQNAARWYFSLVAAVYRTGWSHAGVQRFWLPKAHEFLVEEEQRSFVSNVLEDDLS